jgi:hypothetical protein
MLAANAAKIFFMGTGSEQVVSAEGQRRMNGQWPSGKNDASIIAAEADF